MSLVIDPSNAKAGCCEMYLINPVSFFVDILLGHPAAGAPQFPSQDPRSGVVVNVLDPRLGSFFLEA